jgi:hypothetical protein
MINIIAILTMFVKIESGYPRNLEKLAEHVSQPKLPLAFRQFLFILDHPDQPSPSAIDDCPQFQGEIKVYHSAVASFYTPSDCCGVGGICHEQIRSTPSFHGHPCHDTVFIVLDDTKPGMEIGRVLLFFSFSYRRKSYSCVLINWYVHDDEPDADTGMWTVQLECDRRGTPTVQVVQLETIARGAHLLPIYGKERVPDDFSYHDALDSFNSFFLNHFIDHHAHEFITSQ